MSFKKLLLSFALLIPFVTNSQVTQSMLSESLPLLEVGVGAISIDIPDYPGAGHNTTHTVPFPGAIYRGYLLRADEDGGLRTRFINTPRYEINISVGGQLPADSEENPDRKGMPDLDTMLEFGPGLIVHFLRPTLARKVKFGLNIPFRFVFSTDLKNWDDRGFIFNPILYYIHEGWPLKQITLFGSIDTRWGTSRLNDYFYSVAPTFATPIRPSYRAEGGYMGTSLSLGATYNYKNRLSLMLGIYQSNYSGIANEKSPLLKRKNTTSIGVGIIWWFYQSDIRGIPY